MTSISPKTERTWELFFARGGIFLCIKTNHVTRPTRTERHRTSHVKVKKKHTKKVTQLLESELKLLVIKIGRSRGISGSHPVECIWLHSPHFGWVIAMANFMILLIDLHSHECVKTFYVVCSVSHRMSEPGCVSTVGLVAGKSLLAVNSFGRIFRLDTDSTHHSGWTQLPYLGVDFKRLSCVRNSLWGKRTCRWILDFLIHKSVSVVFSFGWWPSDLSQSVWSGGNPHQGSWWSLWESEVRIFSVVYIYFWKLGEIGGSPFIGASQAI